MAVVDLQRHRRLVRHLVGRNHVFVVVERALERRSDRVTEALDRVVVEVDAALERRQPRLPEDLVDPRAADPGDHALVAQQ